MHKNSTIAHCARIEASKHTCLGKKNKRKGNKHKRIKKRNDPKKTVEEIIDIPLSNYHFALNWSERAKAKTVPKKKKLF